LQPAAAFVGQQRAKQRRRFGRDRAYVVAFASALQAQDHVVRLDRRPRATDDDAQRAAHAVAIDRAPKGFLADDVADTAGKRGRRRGDQLQPDTVATPAGAEQRLEDALPRESVAAGATAGRYGGRLGDGTGDQGVSRARPLARRAESTLRPPTLFIRARKPWVLLRLMTEG
jgi:hypothetical protein